MAYPSKPWSDGQIATDIVPGETFVYNASQSIWEHQTKGTIDSDYQADKIVIESNITAVEGRATALEARATTLETRANNDSDRTTAVESRTTTLEERVDALDLLSDSEAERVQRNIDDINIAMSMLDSDGVALQAIRTDFEAADATLQSNIDAANGDVTALRADLDSDVSALNASITANADLDAVTKADHDSDISNLSIPVVSTTQPAGKAGVLWVNLNDGRLYYWDTVSEVFTEIVTGV